MKFLLLAASWLTFAIICTGAAQAQSLSDIDRQRGRTMLSVIKQDLSKNYYDPNFRGIDLDRKFEAADDHIKKTQSLDEVFAIIAQALMDFDDSHLFFIPPRRVLKVEYGWQFGMVGERCHVIAVKPGSDAETKGLRVGDEVEAIDTYRPTRTNLWIIKYLYGTLRPQPGMTVSVKRSNGNRGELVIISNVQTRKRVVDLTRSYDLYAEIREAENEARLHRHRYFDDIGDTFIWKMPQFDLDENEVDRMIGKVRKHSSLILDLRGNDGGDEKTLLRMVGSFFDRDIKIGDVAGRKKNKPVVARTRAAKAYKGKVVVLIDHQSASASEVFARVMQLEKRAAVIGDRSSGAVMRARHYAHQLGVDKVVPYGVSITDADLVMTDGKSLEKVGVIPDEIVLPTPHDLAATTDPALSRAAALVGIQLSPEKAGSLFPVEWAK